MDWSNSKLLASNPMYFLISTSFNSPDFTDMYCKCTTQQQSTYEYYYSCECTKLSSSGWSWDGCRCFNPFQHPLYTLTLLFYIAFPLLVPYLFWQQIASSMKSIVMCSLGQNSGLEKISTYIYINDTVFIIALNWQMLWIRHYARTSCNVYLDVPLQCTWITMMHFLKNSNMTVRGSRSTNMYFNHKFNLPINRHKSQILLENNAYKLLNTSVTLSFSIVAKCLKLIHNFLGVWSRVKRKEVGKEWWAPFQIVSDFSGWRQEADLRQGCIIKHWL